MNNEENKNKSNKLNINKNSLSSEFINYINTLSDSIKEYHKVSKNTNQNKNILIRELENRLNLYKFNDNNFLNKYKEEFYKLKLNIISDNNNLFFFFEDAKVIFQKMREIHQKLVEKKITKQQSFNALPSAKNKESKNTLLDNPFQQSEINLRYTNNLNDSVPKNNKSCKNRDKKAISHKRKSLNSLNKKDSLVFDRLNKTEDQEKIKKRIYMSKYLDEMEKLRNLNKVYELNIKKLNLALKKYQTERDNNNFLNSTINIKYIQNDSQVIQNELPFNKDIKNNPSIKENYVEKYIKKNMELINKYQIEIKKFKEENNKLKKQNESNKNDSNKYNSLLKENDLLKTNITNSNNSNKNLKKEIDFLKNKINLMEKRLIKEKNKNNELFLIDKNRESEIFTISVNSNINDKADKQIFIETIKSIFEQNKNMNRPWDDMQDNVKKILDNYTDKNEQLKLLQKGFEETIQQLEKQLNNFINGFIEKKQLNIELENNSKSHVKDNALDKKIEEWDINIKHYFNLIQENNLKLIEKIHHLNQENTGKDLKIYKLETENKEMKDNLEKLNDIKNLNCILNETSESRVKNEYKELSKNYEEQKKQNNELKEKLKNYEAEKEKYNKKLLSLGIKFISGQEIKISQNQIFDELNNQIENLKIRNESLKSLLDAYSSQLQNKDSIKNQDCVKIEELKQKANDFLQEKEKKENEIKNLKKENEKLTNHIIKLSKDLPEEFNELQKQYNNLQVKYKDLFSKNKSNNSNSNINSSNNNGEINKILNKMNEIEKENEIIKKKNASLIEKLEEKEIKNIYNTNKSDDLNMSNNYEEEFDLKKMAKTAIEKNRSQDLNIDYPHIQNLKEKYKELVFYYITLEGLVKELLLTIHVNNKNKNNVIQLCKIIGFDPETTNKILNNKSKNLLLGLFQK